MRTVRDIAYTAVFTALLIAAQYALSFVFGLELVTALLSVWSYYMGVRKGVAAAIAFSLLRCFAFGFFPPVIVLYLIYYPFLAAVFGALGHSEKLKKSPEIRIVCVTAAACVCTVLFTLIDDIITPLMSAGRLLYFAYFIASLPVMGIQTACSAVSVPILFPALGKVFSRLGKQR